MFSRGLGILLSITLSVYGRAQEFSKSNPNRNNQLIESRWQGTIVLTDNTEFHCEFSYNPLIPEGILFIKADSTTYSLGVTDIKSFSFYDSQIGGQRSFYSLPVKLGQDKVTRKYFFELIHESDYVSILGRNTFEVKAVLFPYTHSAIFKDYEKYILDHQKMTVHELSKNVILELMENKNVEIQNYISSKHYKLKEKDLDQYIDLVNFYDSLMSQK